VKTKISKLVLSAFITALLPVSALTYAFDFTSEIQTGEFKDYQILTEHFQIEFDYIIYVQPDADGDGIADVVEDIAEYAEYSWDLEVDELGFDQPIPDSATYPYIPIILDDEYEYLGEGTTGLTSVLTDLTPYFAIDPWLSDDLMKVTVAHEFMHCIQFNYDPYFLESYQDLNFAEATAVWTEEYVYPDINDYADYLYDFFTYPDYSIFAGVIPSGTLFEYALSIWPIFLTEYYENDEMMVEIWEDFFEMDYVGARNVFNVYTAVDNWIEEQGDELSEVYREFAIWNLTHDQSYEEGDLYPDVHMMREWFAASVVDQMPLPGMRPALYGTNYINFKTPDGYDDFKFTITKGSDIEMGVTFVPMDDEGEFDLDAIEKESSEIGDTYGEFIFEEASDWEKIYVLVSPIDSDAASGARTFDVGHAYYYSAEFGDFEEEEEVASSDVEVEVEEEEKEGDEVGEDVDATYESSDLTLSVSYYDDESITVSWNRLTGYDIDCYVVYMGEEILEYDSENVVDRAWTTVYTADELESDSIYYFMVEAYDEYDGLLATSEEIAGYTTAFSFGDLNSSDEEYDAVMELWALGIIEGYDDGNFYPDQTVNRAELLKILIEGQGITPDEDEYQGCFDDVEDDWYAKYVCYAEEQGWVQGYGDGNFYPAQTVNKVEALKMLLVVYGYEVDEDEDVRGGMPYTDTWPTAWYAGYVDLAFELGILTEEEGSEFEPEGDRDRGDICMELWGILSQ